MMLAVVRDRARAGREPPRDRSCWPSPPTRRPAASGARTGWSTTTPSCSRAAPRRSARSAASRSPSATTCGSTSIETAEKGIAWLRLTASGTAGHGSMRQRRQRRHRAGRGGRAASAGTSGRSASRRRCGRFLDEVGERARRRARPGRHARRSLAKLGRHGADASARPCATPPTRRCSRPATRHNVIPGEAHRASSTAGSCRAIEEEFFATIARAAGPEQVALRVRRTTTTRWRRRSTAPSSTRCAAALLAEDPGAAAVPYLHVRRHRRQGASAGWASAASASPRCGCRRTSTSPACSTASTSGCRSTRWSSARGCSTASSTRLSGGSQRLRTADDAPAQLAPRRLPSEYGRSRRTSSQPSYSRLGHASQPPHASTALDRPPRRPR